MEQPQNPESSPHSGQIERFDHYMERVLYGPDGFYSSGRGIAGRGSGAGGAPDRSRSGLGGDFITSPEVGALFGRVIANALDAWWDELGQPSTFRVTDAGTGPGTLLTSLRHAALSGAAPRCSAVWELIGVDRASGVDLPDDLSNSVVIANELLDNLVFRILECQVGGWAEVSVESGSERLVSVADPALLLDSALASVIALTDARVGQRVPVLSAAATWVSDVLGRGAERLLIFDYGMATTSELAARGGWLRTYRQHQRGDDPLLEAGEWDITTDLAVDQLPTPALVTTQAEWLTRWGIGELVEEGRQYWQAHAAEPDVAAIRMRSRVGEAEALADPAGLGSWLALEYRR